MKCKERREWGHCGIDVSLNSMDQFEINHLVDRFEAYLHANESATCGGMVIDAPIEEIVKCLIFLRKLTLKEAFKPTVFLEENGEESQKEC